MASGSENIIIVRIAGLIVLDLEKIDWPQDRELEDDADGAASQYDASYVILCSQTGL